MTHFYFFNSLTNTSQRPNNTQWKKNTFRQNFAIVQKNKIDIPPFPTTNYRHPLPLKIYRKELNEQHTNSRHSISMNSFEQPNGYFISNFLNIPNSTYNYYAPQSFTLDSKNTGSSNDSTDLLTTNTVHNNTQTNALTRVRNAKMFVERTNKKNTTYNTQYSPTKYTNIAFGNITHLTTC
jgi:hypothetical protein